MSNSSKKIVVKIDGIDCQLDSDYNPKNDSKLDYMNVQQRAFFKNLLSEWYGSLSSSLNDDIRSIESQTFDIHSVDEGDMANIEAEITSNLRSRDRQRRLMHKIEETIKKIESNTYGFCEETNEPIGIPRLLLRPVTRYCVAVQQEKEQQELDIEDTEYNDDKEIDITDVGTDGLNGEEN